MSLSGHLLTRLRNRLQDTRLKNLLERRLLTHLAFSAASVLLALILASTNVLGGWIIAAALAFSVVLFARPEADRFQAISAVLTVIVSASAIAYIIWRTSTINFAGWYVALPLFVAEVFGTLHLLGFYYTMQSRAEPPLIPTEDPTQLPIFIFVPTVNEGPAILEPTLRGAIAARDRYLKQYPHGYVQIVVCNDGYVAGAESWQETERLAYQLGVRCITRRLPGGAKAGNLENARLAVGATGDALVVIFDADQIPHADFLVRTIPPFADAHIGWVQTGQYYRNLDNPIAAWSNDQQAMFYKLICPGKSPLNSVIICGTNVVIRAKALDQIGGLPQDNITEDMAASIALHGDWRSVYLKEELVSGLGPMDLHSYFKQQRRWATGNLSVLKDHWREIFVPGYGKLSFAQRVQYALACTHYLSGLRDLIYVLVPLVYLIFGVSAIDFTNMETFLRYALPFWLTSQLAFWVMIRGKTGVRGILLTFVSFPVFISSLITVIIGKRVGFQVTAKKRAQTPRFRYIRVHLIGLLLSAIAIGMGLSRLSSNSAPVLMSLFWAGYQTIYLVSVIWVTAADWMSESVWARATAARFWERVPDLHLPMRRLKHNAPAATAFVIALLGGLLVLPIVTREHSGAPPAMGAVTRPISSRTNPVVLAALDTERRPPSLNELVTSDAALVTHGQNIHEDFDPTWANRAQASNKTPWLVLTFDLPPMPPTDDGKQDPRDLELYEYRSAEYGLVAIRNGLRDADLYRLAAQIRAYGGPLYLTPFNDVDRPWGLPSAVANGGKPGDVAPAWARMRAIFQAEGAFNVIWVWSPDDPLGSADMMPPLEQVDAFMVQLERADQRAWQDMAERLAAVRKQYPSLIFLLDLAHVARPGEAGQVAQGQDRPLGVNGR